MKKYILLLVVIMLVLGGCKNKEYITKEQAYDIVLKTIDSKTLATVINPENPKFEEVFLTEDSSFYKLNENYEYKNISYYKITFNIELDGLLGPLVYYVDKRNGDIVGMDYRE